MFLQTFLSSIISKYFGAFNIKVFILHVLLIKDGIQLKPKVINKSKKKNNNPFK